MIRVCKIHLLDLFIGLQVVHSMKLLVSEGDGESEDSACSGEDHGELVEGHVAKQWLIRDYREIVLVVGLAASDGILGTSYQSSMSEKDMCGSTSCRCGERDPS
jgi:hypothetical protein